MLRSQPIIHRNDDSAGPVGQAPAQRVMRVQRANYEPTAMQIDADRQAGLVGRAIDPQIERPSRSLYCPLLHNVNRLLVEICLYRTRCLEGARLFWRHFTNGRHIGSRYPFEHALRARVRILHFSSSPVRL